MKTATATRNRLSPIQADYVNAKARFDTIEDIRRKRFAEIPEIETEDDIDTHVDAEMAIEAALNYTVVIDALRVAEDVLIDWAADKVKAAHGPEHEVWAKLPQMRRSITIRPKLIELCMKLDPRS